MALRKAVVIVNGQLEQLQAGDTLDVPPPPLGPQPYAIGTTSIANGQYLFVSRRVILTGTQRLSIAGTGSLRVS